MLSENPGSICSGSFSYSLMWITGMFIWVSVVVPTVVVPADASNYIFNKCFNMYIVLI